MTLSPLHPSSIAFAENSRRRQLCGTTLVLLGIAGSAFADRVTPADDRRAAVERALASDAQLEAAPVPDHESLPVSALPQLGNTRAGDRPLLEEIGDDHVHADDDVPGAPVAQTPPASDDAWTRIRESRRLDIPDNERVAAQVRTVADERLWISKILKRGEPYIGHIVEALDARYLPVELALLPAIESGFRPRARSGDEATGLWQFVPETADDIGLERTEWFDGRADIVASTTAAIDYLGYLNATFHGDWELTLAAYNAGLGRVRTAMKRNLDAGLPADFWSLRLPRETREYVPKLFALIDLLRNGDPKSLELASAPTGASFRSIDVGRRLNLERAARLGGVSLKTLRQLNAGLVHDVTPPDGPHTLYVPDDVADIMQQRLDQAGARALQSHPRTHTVVAGDTLSHIAYRYGVSEARLRTLNALQGETILIGQTLSVIASDPTAATTSAESYVVTNGDTLSTIASRYDVPVDAIVRTDGSRPDGDMIFPGDKLLVLRSQGEPG